MQTGVCYYPEHWPESQWPSDAQRMRDIGLSTVRVGEFAWSKLEPVEGQYEFDWLERAINVLHEHGLNIILGTPTATPPRWLTVKLPTMFAVDEYGHEKGFGSRRHYCFSSIEYQQECQRIVTALAERFGENPAIVAWQTDNEYGCHSTSISYSDAALNAFQIWCKNKYSTIEQLNSAWGNVFWSMEFDSFETITAPVGAVTETNPAHRLAYWKFSSEQIVSFNLLQVDILRAHSPGRDIVHNFMGNFVEFDHFDVSESLDVASWDNYPLGFLTRDGVDAQAQQDFLRTGHPDSSAFHHELYRSCGKGRLWLMEQQPGPVNWAPHNPAPLTGMVRLWGWEALAHSAELVCYFRWRQAPFAQEQMHSGLCLPNGDNDDAAHEVKQLNQEIQLIADYVNKTDNTNSAAKLAIVFDYAGDQAQRIQQPGGQHYDPLIFVQRVYSACRQLGIEVDIIPTSQAIESYSALIIGNVTIADNNFVAKLKQFDGEILFLPRSGSKTNECAIPENLPPGLFQALIPLQINRVESLPDSITINTRGGLTIIDWRERANTTLQPDDTAEDGWGVSYQSENYQYLCACLDQPSLLRYVENFCKKANLKTHLLSNGLRIKQCGNLCFAFNFGPQKIELDHSLTEHFKFGANSAFLVGQSTLHAAEMAIWNIE